jgi:hypothetical protein
MLPCNTRHELAERYEQLLREYNLKFSELIEEEGIVRAEQQTVALRLQCVQARKALHRYDEEHDSRGVGMVACV